MIKCKNCAAVTHELLSACPECGREIILSAVECDDLIDDAKRSVKKREYENAIKIYKFLAEKGVTEAERELALILERGELLPRDLDGAMKLFFSAANKNDSFSAYRYSRLAARTSDKASDFWLAYSALLGCREAFADAAEMYSDMGEERCATYYYSLAADAGDTDSIVTMAKRYYDGVGAEKSLPYAKWYMEKLTIPPLHAFKLALKLRSTSSEIPPEPIFEDYAKTVKALWRDAKKYGLDKAYLHLTELQARSGVVSAKYVLGSLYADGVGTEKDIDKAISILEEALAEGSPDAANLLGDIFVSEKYGKRDIDRAIGYYNSAAEGGEGGAYRKLGDMFAEGRLVGKNVAYAISLYEMGAERGDEECGSRADELKSLRESHYYRAKEKEGSSPEEAFENYFISTLMGYLPAHSELARCYENGIGTKKDRRLAFFWYKTATDHSDTDSLFDLGRCYAYGIGTEFNYDKAVELFALAKRYGSTRAEAELNRLYRNKGMHILTSLYSSAIRLIYKKKFAEAADILSTLADAGYPKGSYVLGCLYEFGLGVRTSRDTAFELYNSAFAKGLRDPRQYLKLKILRMAR